MAQQPPKQILDDITALVQTAADKDQAGQQKQLSATTLQQAKQADDDNSKKLSNADTAVDQALQKLQNDLTQTYGHQVAGPAIGMLRSHVAKQRAGGPFAGIDWKKFIFDLIQVVFQNLPQQPHAQGQQAGQPPKP